MIFSKHILLIWCLQNVSTLLSALDSLRPDQKTHRFSWGLLAQMVERALQEYSPQWEMVRIPPAPGFFERNFESLKNATEFGHVSTKNENRMRLYSMGERNQSWFWINWSRKQGLQVTLVPAIYDGLTQLWSTKPKASEGGNSG